MQKVHSLRLRPFAAVWFALAACVADEGSGLGTIEVPMKPEERSGYRGNPTKPYGELRQDFTTVRLEPIAGGRYSFQVGAAAGGPRFPEIDARWFVPRVPMLARGDATLTRVALMQREFNRNETRFGAVGDYAESKIANNCLRAGLWEVVFEQKKDDGSTGMRYHGWFEFPADHYARVFEEANGFPFAEYKKQLAEYPAMGGFAFPLQKLRTVTSEKSVTSFDQHLKDPFESFSEQKRKASLVLTPGITTYGDYVDPGKQPIRTAKFSEPGFYDLDDPCSFDLAWLGRPASIQWRRVKGVADPVELDEIEVRYENGFRLLVGDAGIAGLRPLARKPEKDAETLRITFGIGTPDIYATLAERKAEFESPRANYLVLLDAQGNHLDNHALGVDRAFVWRGAMSEGGPDELHLYLVGYERITTVSHLSIPWSTP